MMNRFSFVGNQKRLKCFDIDLITKYLYKINALILTGHSMNIHFCQIENI